MTFAFVRSVSSNFDQNLMQQTTVLCLFKVVLDSGVHDLTKTVLARLITYWVEMSFSWCKLQWCVLKVIIWHTTGSTKKRNNHIIQSVKLVKVDGSILAINISPRSNHLAVGSDIGYVSLLSDFALFILISKLFPF